eukprot:6773212-Prymnesium_polylepis.2
MPGARWPSSDGYERSVIEKNLVDGGSTRTRRERRLRARHQWRAVEMRSMGKMGKERAAKAVQGGLAPRALPALGG